jgi:hypothetical protein
MANREAGAAIFRRQPQQVNDSLDNNLQDNTDSIGALLCALSAANLSPTAKAGIKAIIEIDRGTD